ncbi:MAG: polysaccharide deacetylase family protein [Gammaproteobacteria bacterium]|nr:polysaccharide deacetylase family protein [Gammaproteobacteria bacterium]
MIFNGLLGRQEKKRHYSSLVMLSALLIFSGLTKAKDDSDSQLSILLYHHIDDSTPKITSTAPALFKQHLNYLKKNDFNVMPLNQALDQLFKGKTLPAKSVAITFDDGYESIYKTAWPILKEYNYPFTVFVATEPVEKAYALMMNWQQLSEISNAGVTLANHTHTHAHLLSLLPKQFINEINMADKALDKQSSLSKQFSHTKSLFAYPYGEYSKSITDHLKQDNRYAVAQVSGAVSRYSNPQALPRFSFSGNYGSMEQFKLKVNSVAMPVIQQANYDPLINPSVKSFTLKFDSLPFAKSGFNCFYQNETIDNIEWDQSKVTITISQKPIEGRSRINCTAPASNGRFFWHSIPIFVKPSSGNWPE